MNDAAEEIISKDNNYSAMTNAICNRCEGYSNEFALQSCINCYLDTTKPNDMNFQVFMKTVDNKIQPFTASYQCIDDEGTNLRFYITRYISTNRATRKDVSTSDVT